MPRVLRTDVKSGTTVELNVPDKVWKRICKVPSVFGANLKWKLAPTIIPVSEPQIISEPEPQIISEPEPVNTPGQKPQFDKGADHKPHDDLAEDTKTAYGKESYKYDCDQGKALFKSGEYQKALGFLERALVFQPKNQYIRGLIKKIKDNG